MDSTLTSKDLGRLIRQRGLPEQPSAIEQVSEVRSDCYVPMVPAPASHTSFSLEAVTVQWRFKLSYTKAAEFHKFLAENEQYIAECCKQTLPGVHYHGTYMYLNGKRSEYTTIWSYDSWQAQGEWERILSDKSSRFYQAVCNLRAFWTSDPDSTQEHFGVAAGIDLENTAFLAITVDAERRAAANKI